MFFFIFIARNIQSKHARTQIRKKAIGAIEKRLREVCFGDELVIAVIDLAVVTEIIFNIIQDILNTSTNDSRLHAKLFDEGKLTLFVRTTRYLTSKRFELAKAFRKKVEQKRQEEIKAQKKNAGMWFSMKSAREGMHD